jgi:hypothetical protein
MSATHTRSHAAEVTQKFAQGGLAITVVIVAVISLATLVYVWFFT